MAPLFELRSARLRVASLERSAAFYGGVLGLDEVGRRPGARLFAASPGGAPLLTLIGIPGAAPAPPDAAGLFHLAFLVPERADLARVLSRLAARRQPLQGLSDHGVSEAIYLADLDENGLELYWDRPRAEWPQRDGRLEMYTERLDVPGLLAAAPGDAEAGLPPGTRLGHVHLRVTDLADAERFYTKELPLEVTARGYRGALFFAAEGYHHHVGTNTWGVTARRTAGGPERAGRAGLEAVVAGVRGLPEARSIADPDGNRFELEPN